MCIQPNWLKPLPELALTNSDVHIWRASLDVVPGYLEALSAMLSEDEKIRANRLASALDRSRFIAARGILREILALYTGTTPVSISFKYGPWGKPALDAMLEGARLEFNLAHSAGLALYAIALDGSIGVDIEKIRAMQNAEALTRRFFSSEEADGLRILSNTERTEAFFHLWTRKEALAKAEGVPLLQRTGSTLTLGWFIHDIDPGPGFKGCIAAKGEDFRITCLQWPKS